MKTYVAFLILCTVPLMAIGQVVEISGGTQPVTYPFKSGYGYDYSAMLYLASEISATGDIVKVSFYHNGGTSLKDVPCSIRMKLTTDATLTSLDWGTLTSGATTVFSGTFRYTSATAGWVTFTLSSPFALTPGNNLLVLTTASAADGGDPWGSGGGEMHYAHAASSMAGNLEQDMTAPTTLTAKSYRSNIQLDFTPLPVQLVGFAAQMGDGMVTLSWRTISEVNNYGFTVQAKAQSSEVFTDITGAFVPGHGTTTEEYQYSWTIASPDPDAIAYRLKQTDLDGSVHYSEPVTLRVTDVATITPVAFMLEQNYPNPFNPSTSIRFGVPVTGHVTIAVYSALGQEVATLADGEYTAGYHQAVLNGSRLASGVYYYRMAAPGFTQVRSLLLTK
jgi:hypothetical protein